MGKTFFVVFTLVLAICCCIIALCSGLIFVSRSVRSTVSDSPKVDVLYSVPEDFKVTLSKGVCFGFCPVYDVTVHADGTTVFEGQRYVEAEGKTEYKIDEIAVQKIYSYIKIIDFFAFKNRYENMTIADLPSATITLTANNQTKSIYMYGLEEDIPKELQELITLIDDEAETEKLVGNTQIPDDSNDLPVSSPQERDSLPGEV